MSDYIASPTPYSHRVRGKSNWEDRHQKEDYSVEGQVFLERGDLVQIMKFLSKFNLPSWRLIYYGLMEKCKSCEKNRICPQPAKPGYEHWCEKSPDWEAQIRMLETCLKKT